MIDSDKLRHFPIDDPPTPSARETVRRELERHIAHFLSCGGSITQVEATVSTEPVLKRKKRDQIRWVKRTIHAMSTKRAKQRRNGR